MTPSFVFLTRIDLTHEGRRSQRVHPWGAGALVQDLLCGPGPILAHALALPELAEDAYVHGRVQLSLDYDSQTLVIERDAVCGLSDASVLRRAYRRALCRAWPDWTLSLAQDRRTNQARVTMTFARELPDPSAPRRSLITLVDRDGHVRDFSLGLSAEVALAIGPSLIARLHDWPTQPLAREAELCEGQVRSWSESGALIDETRKKIELWWDGPSPLRWALAHPLARLWPGYAVTSHDEGLPRQIAGSGRDPRLAGLSEAEAEALLEHRLFHERGYDPDELQTRLHGCLVGLLAAGVPLELPAYLPPSPGSGPPRPEGARVLARQVNGSGHHGPALYAIEPALRRFAAELDGDGEALARALRWLLGPPAWNVLVLDELERTLDPRLRAPVLEQLATRWRLDLRGPSPILSRIDRVREALVDRVRQHPRSIATQVR